MTNATTRWLAAARSTNDPAGDLIADMRRESDVPPLFANIREMRSYLRKKGACAEAMAAVSIVWRRYRNWLDRHPFNVTL
jgi:hypothetical protein